MYDAGLVDPRIAALRVQETNAGIDKRPYSCAKRGIYEGLGALGADVVVLYPGRGLPRSARGGDLCGEMADGVASFHRCDEAALVEEIGAHGRRA